jgi:hypothetical protein
MKNRKFVHFTTELNIKILFLSTESPKALKKFQTCYRIANEIETLCEFHFD